MRAKREKAGGWSSQPDSSFSRCVNVWASFSTELHVDRRFRSAVDGSLSAQTRRHRDPPSQTDSALHAAHSFLGHTPDTYIPRKNSCDYLFEVGSFRLHLVSPLLGSHPESFVKSSYISPGAANVQPGAFNNFPPCFVHYGTGERCQEEGERLVRNLRRDGVRVEVVVTEDTPHDLLLLEMIWNKRQINEIWDGAVGFLQTL